MAPSIKAVGFDMDGTFLRTHVDYPKLGNVDREVCGRHGIPFDEIDFGRSSKRPRGPIRDWLEAHDRGSEWDAIYAELDARSTVLECEYVDEAEPFPGSVEALREIRARGYRAGLLTRGSLEYARRALGPLFCEFDFVMGRDYSTYDESKPSPVAMLQFCAELGVEPSEMLYVGDNTTDWESARGAGAMFAGVLTGTCGRSDWEAADPAIPVLACAADVLTLLRRPFRFSREEGRRGLGAGPAGPAGSFHWVPSPRVWVLSSSLMCSRSSYLNLLRL